MTYHNPLLNLSVSNYRKEYNKEVKKMHEKSVVLNLIFPNDIQIISMTFPTFEAGLRKCKEILGFPNKIYATDSYKKAVWSIDDKRDYEKVKSFLIDYYYGECGGVSEIELKEVPNYAPLCSFELD